MIMIKFVTAFDHIAKTLFEMEENNVNALKLLDL